MASAGKKRRRWGLWGLGVVVIILSLVCFLPFLASTVLRGPLLGVVNGQLGANVQAETVTLSWSGEQLLEGVRITPDNSRHNVPGTSPGELLVIDRLRVGSGLFALAFSPQKPIDVQVDGLQLEVHRSKDGRFNFEDLLGKKAGQPGDVKPPAQDDAPTKDAPKKDTPEPTAPRRTVELPSLPREVHVTVRNAELTYRDEKLAAFSALRGVTLDLHAAGGTAKLAFEARVASSPQDSTGQDGRLAVSGALQGLGDSVAWTQLDVWGDATIEGLTLAPYRGLLEEFAQVSPPEEPISGHVHIVVKDGTLALESRLDAGVALLEALKINVPAAGTLPAEIHISLPKLDLFGGLEVVRRHLSLPEGTTVAGNFGVELKGTGAWTLEKLLSGEDLTEVPFSLEAHTTITNLALVLPPATHDAGTEKEEAQETAAQETAAQETAAPPAPLRLEEKEASLVVVVSQDARKDGGTNEPVQTEGGIVFQVDARSSAVKAQLGGHVRGSNAQAHGALHVTVPELLKQLPVAVPDDLEIGDGTQLELSNLHASARLDGDDPAATVAFAAHVNLTGELAFQGYDLRSLEADLNYTDQTATLKAVKAALSDGELVAEELFLDLGKEPPEYHGAVVVENVRATYEMTKLFAYAIPFLSLEDEKADFSGRVSAELEIDGRGFETSDLESSLKGKGKLRIREGKLAASKFFLKVAGLLGGKQEDLYFSELGSDFDIGNARILAHKVFVLPRADSKLRDLGLKGVTGFDGALDFSVDLATLQATIGDKRIDRILGKAREVLGGDAFPLRLGGTLEAPRLSLVSPLTQGGKGRKGSKLPQTGIEGVLERGLDELLGGKKKDEKKTPPAEEGKSAEATKKPREEPAPIIEEIFDLFKKKKKKKRRKPKE